MADVFEHGRFSQEEAALIRRAAGLGVAPDAAPWAPTAPHFVDFSFPVTHVDSWSATGDDVIEASVAELMGKERRLCVVLHQTIQACGQLGATPPAALVESEEILARHWDALAALHPFITFPFGRHAHRALFAVTLRLRRLLANMSATGVSYPSRLYELYVVASDVSIGYFALQATALALGDRCAAAVAARHLRHTDNLLETVHALVPCASVRELESHGLRPSTDELWDLSGAPAPG